MNTIFDFWKKFKIIPISKQNRMIRHTAFISMYRGNTLFFILNGLINHCVWKDDLLVIWVDPKKD